MEFTGGGTVTIKRTAGRDRYGERLPVTAEEQVHGAMWGPRSQRVATPASVDVTGSGREGRRDQLVVFIPSGQPLPEHTDLLVIEGEDWEMEGRAMPWENGMTGWRPGSIATAWRQIG